MSEEEAAATKAPKRRHILVTGGFGSLGKHVVRELLLGAAAQQHRDATERELANGAGPSIDNDEDGEVVVTLLDVQDKTDELDYLLQSAPLEESLKMRGTDPRAQAFTSSERSVEHFRRTRKLRIILGDVRDGALMKALLSSGSSSQTSAALRLADIQAGNIKRPKPKGHLDPKTSLPPVTGIVHLAAYSPVDCRLNPTDCTVVEEEGMAEILAAIRREDEESAFGPTAAGERPSVADRPWIVMPRRAEGWVEYANITNYAASKEAIAAGEKALKDFATKHPLHAVLLRLPSQHSFIGDAFASRFDPVPHMIESALGDIPINPPRPLETPIDPFIAVEDGARSVIQSALMLDLASRKEYLQAFAFVGELKIVGPTQKGLPDPEDFAEHVIAVTKSKSPLAIAALDEDEPVRDLAVEVEGRWRQQLDDSRKVATKALGYTPSIDIDSALRAHVASLLRRQDAHLSSRISVACSTPPAIPVLEDGLLGLNGCSVQLLTVIEGSYHTLGCSQGLDSTVSRPVSVLTAVPYKEGVRGVEIRAERGTDGRVDIQMRCPAVDTDGKLIAGQADVVTWASLDGKPSDGGLNEGFAESSRQGVKTIAEWYTVDFVHRESRAFTLSLPLPEGVTERDEPRRRLMFRSARPSDMSMTFLPIDAEMTPIMWRINPVCCAKPRSNELWDFFKEDPLLTSQVEYPPEDGRTSLIDSTLSTHRCLDLRAQHERITKVQGPLLLRKSKDTCQVERGEAVDWSAKDTKTCMIDCTAPLKCIARDGCKCTRDRCGATSNRDGPFPRVAYTNRRSFDDLSKEPDQRPKSRLLRRIEELHWDKLVLPAARGAFNSPLRSLPQAHVVDLPTTIDTHLQSEACYKLEKSPLPFMGDHVIVEALRNRSVSIDEADFVMVPFYQVSGARLGATVAMLIMDSRAATTTTFKRTPSASLPTPSALPRRRSQDTITSPQAGWSCRSRTTLARAPAGGQGSRTFSADRHRRPWTSRSLGRLMATTTRAASRRTAMSSCLRSPSTPRHSLRPSETSTTSRLCSSASISASLQVASVASAPSLVLASAVEGQGRTTTAQSCTKNSRPASDTLAHSTRASSACCLAEYQPGVSLASPSRGCLLTRLALRRTTRTFEAIYAGCIPAFIVDRNTFPYQDILDYSRFSITIPENESHKLEEILADYDNDRLLDMQATLLKVREAFIFEQGREWERKGPLFHALVSMQMRLDLEFPRVGTC